MGLGAHRGFRERVSVVTRAHRACAAMLLVLAGTLCVPGVSAHTLGQTYLYMSINETELSARFEVTAADLNKGLGLALPEDGSLGEKQLALHEGRIAAYLKSKVRLTASGEPATLEFHSATLRNTTLAQYILTEFRAALQGVAPKFVDVEYGVLFDEEPTQQGIILIENNWRSGTFDNEARVTLTLSADSRSGRVDLSDATMFSGFRHMVWLGGVHIIEGIDHVMFLFALLLMSVVRRVDRRWQGVESFRSAAMNVLVIVTMFTIAHTITLSLSVLGVLAIGERLVESVIVASIVLAAAEVFFPVFGKRMNLVVFLFGLFHGAGFASVLLSMNIHADYLLLTLLGFNFGVEIGQLLIVVALFPVLFFIRGTRTYLHLGMPVAAFGLILVAGYWFIERAFDVDLPAGEYAQKLLDLLLL